MDSQSIATLREFRTGTTITAFSTTEFLGIDEQYPGYVVYNSQGNVGSIHHYDGKIVWGRNENNNFIDLSTTNENYITGYTFTVSRESLINDNQKNRTVKKIKNSVPFEHKNTTYVLFEEELIDDYFVNISVSKNYDTLDTFNVYNRVINSQPQQQSNTGVVIGKLEAIQKIKDINGEENLRIPLSDVPIGIFLPSVEFPNISSRDSNGERAVYNFLSNEPYEETTYSNTESFDFDKDFLKNLDGQTGITNTYKLFTKTNENGEFVLYDVPTGTQTLVFDVDILKQGLTKEEVALNFFPYPTDDEPNIDNVPHFFSRQIPIDVLPSWGDFQTGYTEVNISANLDLRKWVTYFLPPVSYNDQTLPELQLDGFDSSLKVSIRDMSKENFGSLGLSVNDVDQIRNLTPTQLVRLDSTGPRDTQQEIGWLNEFSLKTNKVNFTNIEYNAIKLPANIYHPNLFPTYSLNKDSITKKKGTWFAGYQLNITVNGNSYRSTGFFRENENSFGRDHFRLTYNVGRYGVANDAENSEDLITSESIKSWPYERPWNHLYPSEVKIPIDPSNNINENPGFDNPKYSDGDKVGFINEDTYLAYGFGLQNFETAPTSYVENKFARTITSKHLFLTETSMSYNDEYSNGWGSFMSDDSMVENGESFQRMECGYAYFLKPDGWPDVRMSNGLEYLDLTKDYDDVYIPEDGLFNVFINLSTSQGNLNFYRVYNPSPSVILSPQSPPIYTYFKIEFGFFFRDLKTDSAQPNRLGRYETNAKNDNDRARSTFIALGQDPIENLGEEANIPLFNYVIVRIYNLGEINVTIDSQIVSPGSFIEFNFYDSNPDAITLQANSIFDPSTNKFTKQRYDIEILDDRGEGSIDGYSRQPLDIGMFKNSSYRNFVSDAGKETSVYQLGEFNPVEEGEEIPVYHSFTDFLGNGQFIIDGNENKADYGTAEGLFIEYGGYKQEGFFFFNLDGQYLWDGNYNPVFSLGNFRRNVQGSDFSNYPLTNQTDGRADNVYYFYSLYRSIVN